MDLIMAGQGAGAFWVAVAVTLVAGFVKGAVGFAMPMIMIGAFSSFLPPDLALAGLILPTLVTNLSQSLRQGLGPALATTAKFWRFLLAMAVFIVVSAQFVRVLPQPAMLLLLGVPITAYAMLNLSGRNLTLHLRHQRGAEWGLGVLGGLYGGVSGVWGPPLLVYLLSTGVPKLETVRALGVAFLLGAVTLLGAHIQTGLANPASLGFSAALVIPAQIGMSLGYALQDRLDQNRFRWWTQAVLIVMGLNLIRRALM